MNWDRVAGNWQQFKGKIKERWGDLTDDDLTQIAGKRDQLAGRVQERYGKTKDAVESEIHEFESKHAQTDALDDTTDPLVVTANNNRRDLGRNSAL